MTTLSLHLHLRKDKKGVGNTFPLFIRLSSKGISAYHSLGVKLKLTEWDSKKSEIRLSSVNTHFNKDLLIIKSRFIELLNSLPYNMVLTKNDLKEFMIVLVYGNPQCTNPLKGWTKLLKQFRTIKLGNYEKREKVIQS